MISFGPDVGYVTLVAPEVPDIGRKSVDTVVGPSVGDGELEFGVVGPTRVNAPTPV